MSTICAVVTLSVVCADHVGCSAHSALNIPNIQWQYCDGALQRYAPQTGDVVLFKYRKRITQLFYTMFLARGVTHVAMVVRRPNGSLAFLDAPGMRYPVMLNDVDSRLQFYDGKMWVRRLRCPLSPQQSACLTDFACAQDGKKFHGLGIVIPTFGSPRRKFGFFCTSPKRLQLNRWFCSSLTMAASISCGLLDGCEVRPRFTNPQDLFGDDSIDLSHVWGPPNPLQRCGPRQTGWWSEGCNGCRRYWEKK